MTPHLLRPHHWPQVPGIPQVRSSIIAVRFNAEQRIVRLCAIEQSAQSNKKDYFVLIPPNFCEHSVTVQ